VAKDATAINVSLTVSPIIGTKGKVIGAAAIAHDTTEEKKAMETLRRTQEKLRIALEKEKEAARSDFLTGLANRRSFCQTVDFEVRRTKRYPRPITLAFIDVDDFKRVNDRMGHEAGDELLVSVASTMKRILRESDIRGPYWRR